MGPHTGRIGVASVGLSVQVLLATVVPTGCLGFARGGEGIKGRRLKACSCSGRSTAQMSTLRQGPLSSRHFPPPNRLELWWREGLIPMFCWETNYHQQWLKTTHGFHLSVSGARASRGGSESPQAGIKVFTGAVISSRAQGPLPGSLVVGRTQFSQWWAQGAVFLLTDFWQGLLSASRGHPWVLP